MRGASLFAAVLLLGKLFAGVVGCRSREPAADAAGEKPHPESFASALDDAELKRVHGCVDSFTLSEDGGSFKALVFDEGPLGFKVVFYRKQGDTFSATSVNGLGDFERPFLRGGEKPRIAARHHQFRAAWSFRYESGVFRFEPDAETIENGVRYTVKPGVEVDKAAFAREVLGDAELARQLEDAGSRTP